jgi:aminoglycoside/choline kinase family phosphotransferase
MDRVEIIENWLKSQLNQNFTIEPASSDASFRRYFRITSNNETYILMDAPPNLERIDHFVDITNKLIAAEINSPKIISFDTELGLILMTDFGSQTFLDVLDSNNSNELYLKAIHSLLKIQTKVDTQGLQDYSEELLVGEMSLFPEWYLTKLKKFTPEDKASLSNTFSLVTKKILTQNKCFVHRDYHSRNLMFIAKGNPGILDYQDAVLGPLTYDLVSLLKDAYIEWDEDFVLDQSVRYWEKAKKAGLVKNKDFSSFYEDFEWTGVQRHLKILGIFSRLSIRDKKDQYLKDIPLVEKYLMFTSERYKSLHPLRKILDKVVS